MASDKFLYTFMTLFSIKGTSSCLNNLLVTSAACSDVQQSAVDLMPDTPV
jgi:hypothetical protein